MFKLLKNSSAILLAMSSTVTLAAPDLITKGLSQPKDPAIVNKSRIEYWMKERGQINSVMSREHIEKLVNEYASRAHPGKLPQLPKVEIKPTTIEMKSASSSANSMTKTVNVLSVLIDFPDLRHDSNGLSSSDTDMYYDSYPVSHYQNLQFSTTGFTGPSGQNLLSGYQYYQAESGGTFFFNGTTYGWVRADENHAFYGGNDPENNNNDKNVGTLVTEAVNKAFAANTINLADFDIEDQFDIDGDGILNEPDGFIDHVMIYHSSVGEEAGGGVAGNDGDDAIWSHRFFVNPTNSWATRGADISGSEYQPGKPYRVWGYTVQPIDAATGVVVHEFGHDLGLPDEYDTASSEIGEPVGLWSLMSGGSWTGSLAGTEPSGFSPYARHFLQESYGGNWIDQTVLTLSDLTESGTQYNLTEAVNHYSALNQIKITMPISPAQGDSFYYSQEGDNLNNSMSFTMAIGSGSSAELAMKANWQIEEDYDYAQVKINGTAIKGNHTINGPNQYHPSVTNYISNSSSDITGASTFGWVDLTFDVSAYMGQTVTVSFEYITDAYVGGYGLLIDDINLSVDNVSTYSDNAESGSSVNLNDFTTSTGLADSGKGYYIQLRSHNDVDSGLGVARYVPGVVLWYENAAYGDNQVDVHPGYGFIGVVDADQVLNNARTHSTFQVRDAAFGLYAQSSYTGDTNLGAISSFDDSNDYSSPSQPQSGLILPELGISFEVTAQSNDSSTASILLKRTLPVPEALTANFTTSTNFRTVSFTDNTNGGATSYSYNWDFGDGSTSTQQNPTHTYSASGNYTVSLTVTDSEDATSTHTTEITIADALEATIQTVQTDATVEVSAQTTGGSGDITYQWTFEQGAEASGQTASYTYTASGSYTITLNVSSSGDNQSATVTDTVEIYIPPSASFTAQVSNLTATFTNTSSGGAGAISYSWEFGDGGTSTSSSASHTYQEAGTYTVTLTMTDGENVTSTFSRSVTVTEPPKSGGGGGSINFGLLLVMGSLILFRRRL